MWLITPFFSFIREVGWCLENLGACRALIRDVGCNAWSPDCIASARHVGAIKWRKDYNERMEKARTLLLEEQEAEMRIAELLPKGILYETEPRTIINNYYQTNYITYNNFFLLGGYEQYGNDVNQFLNDMGQLANAIGPREQYDRDLLTIDAPKLRNYTNNTVIPLVNSPSHPTCLGSQSEVAWTGIGMFGLICVFVLGALCAILAYTCCYQTRRDRALLNDFIKKLKEQERNVTTTTTTQDTLEPTDTSIPPDLAPLLRTKLSSDTDASPTNPDTPATPNIPSPEATKGLLDTLAANPAEATKPNSDFTSSLAGLTPKKEGAKSLDMRKISLRRDIEPKRAALLTSEALKDEKEVGGEEDDSSEIDSDDDGLYGEEADVSEEMQGVNAKSLEEALKKVKEEETNEEGEDEMEKEEDEDETEMELKREPKDVEEDDEDEMGVELKREPRDVESEDEDETEVELKREPIDVESEDDDELGLELKREPKDVEGDDEEDETELDLKREPKDVEKDDEEVEMEGEAKREPKDVEGHSDSSGRDLDDDNDLYGDEYKA